MKTITEDVHGKWLVSDGSHVVGTFDRASDAAAFVEAVPELIAFSEHGEHSDEAG
jgi:hypothetical protein